MPEEIEGGLRFFAPEPLVGVVDEILTMESDDVLAARSIPLGVPARPRRSHAAPSGRTPVDRAFDDCPVSTVSAHATSR
jgi:hypothetical protein